MLVRRPISLKQVAVKEMKIWLILLRGVIFAFGHSHLGPFAAVDKKDLAHRIICAVG